MNTKEKLGKAIVQLRTEQGLSQYNFALKSKLSFRYLSDIENGKRNLSVDILERIAMALDVKISDIFVKTEKFE